MADLDAAGGLPCLAWSDLEEATWSWATKLGEGGYGVVYNGTLAGFGRVAVKRLRARGASASFSAEAAVGAALPAHPRLSPLSAPRDFCLGTDARYDARMGRYSQAPDPSLATRALLLAVCQAHETHYPQQGRPWHEPWT